MAGTVTVRLWGAVRWWTRALGFVGVGLCLHVAASLAYVHIVDTGHKASRSDQLFYDAPDRIDLIIAGDSHSRSGIDPKMMGPRVLNLAVGGEHYLKTYYRLRTLIEHADKEVGALILPLDPNSFSAWHAENFAPEYVWGRYVDFFEVGRLRHQPWAYTGKWVKARFAPYTGELRTFNQLRSKRFGFGEDLAQGNFDQLTLYQRREMAKVTASEHFSGAEPFDPVLHWAFDELIHWATGRGIKVVCVSFPLTDEYVAAIRPYQNGSVRREVVDPMVAAGETPFLDYHDLLYDRDDLFADPHHLNRKGRVGFTRRVQQRLVELEVLPESYRLALPPER